MYEKRWSLGFGSALTPMVRNLLLINIVVYFLQLLAGKIPSLGYISYAFALHPALLLNTFAIWQLVTYLFLHGNFFHLLFNMFTLWMFGCEVERTLGTSRFLRLYFLSGIGAALFHLLFNYSSHNPVIGASGAIYGILVTFALLFPDRIITLLLFFIFPIQLKAKYLVGIFLLISLFSGVESEIFGVTDGIAHFAHLGGALTAFLLIRGETKIESLFFEIRKRKEWQKMATQKRKDALQQQKQEEIDRILDRINEVGYENISEHEKIALKKASKFIKEH